MKSIVFLYMMLRLDKKEYQQIQLKKYQKNIILIYIKNVINYRITKLKSDIEPIFGDKRDGDIPHSNADISKASNMLGYKPLVLLGLSNFI